MSGSASSPAAWRAPEDHDLEKRLLRFAEAHPEVILGGGGGFRQARIPEENGETVITRYTLRELLDKLGTIFPDLPGPRGISPPEVPRARRPYPGRAGRGQR